MRTILRAAIIALSLAGSAAFAQTGIIDSGSANVPVEQGAGAAFLGGSAVIAPIPSENPTFGRGLALGVGYLFTLPGAKPSGFGIGGYKSENGSEAYGLGANIVTSGGKWRGRIFAGDANLNYDLGVGNFKIPLNQTATTAGFGADYFASKELSLGATVTYAESTVSLNSALLDKLPEFLRPRPELDLLVLTLGARYDTRDDVFYPSSGFMTDLLVSAGETTARLFGGRLSLPDTDYRTALLSFSGYRPLGKDGVLAGRAVVCGSTDNTPFFVLCGLGLSDRMRGFDSTSNLANYTTSVQAEYRGRLTDRLGYVAFAGTGGKGSNLSDALSFGDRYAAGAGLRVRLSKDYALDYSVDWAFDNKGEEYLYVYVSQRF